jgi:hypothetical protein
VAPLVPWYLDKDSGGPNPAVKKAGIQYDVPETDPAEDHTLGTL